MTLGVDVGGTFTDLAVWDGSSLRIGKTSSTTEQSEGVVDGARELLGDRSVPAFLHGTTVATNALLERRGARTALITDAGFRDLLEIGRQDRPALYDSHVERPAPLVPRDGRIEVAGHGTQMPAGHGTQGSAGRGTQGSAGELTAGERDALLDALRAYAPEAVAICLLYGYEDPTRERHLVALLRDHLDVPVCSSHGVSGEFREFERASTTVLNAYLTPVVERYLRALQGRAREAGLPERIEVMRSSGGLMSVEAACELPAAVLLSGPAGGVVASAELGRSLDLDHVVSFDMGGTSTDVCRIDHGRPEVSYERDLDGFPCRLPSVAVHTVGAGGGSIAWIDDGGALRVGPRSAGAHPGPACYGRGGTDATVTDANLVLGRLDPKGRLAGTVELDHDAAHRAVADLGARIGLEVADAALGILRVAEEHMARAIRVVSVEEGSDPRDAALVSFGGAGGLHATALARALQMSAVVVPPYAGVFSAVGLLLSPRRTDRARSATLDLDDTEGLARLVDEVAAEARRDLLGDHLGEHDEAGSGTGERRTDVDDRVEVEVRLDVRYLGQAHETPVAYTRGDDAATIAERFHDAHHRRNGFARPGDPIEVVTIRAEATAPPALRWDQLPELGDEDDDRGEARGDDREVTTSDGVHLARVWRRGAFRPGDEVVGPAVIEEREATVYLDVDEHARVLPSGALRITW